MTTLADEIETLKMLLITIQEKLEEQKIVYFRKGYLQACKDVRLKLTSQLNGLIDDVGLYGAPE